MKNNQINALAALAALAARSIWRHSTNGRYPGFKPEIWVRGTKAFQYFVGCSTWLHFFKIKLYHRQLQIIYHFIYNLVV